MINPPARRRPPINPPARRAPPTAIKQEGADWSIPAGARPLAPMQETHNGVKRSNEMRPDERFRPLLIAHNPDYARTPCPSTGWKVKKALDLTANNVQAMPGYVAAGYYISEFILRDRMGYKLMADDAYDALREYLFSIKDDNDKERINDAQKSMMSFDADGDITVDFTKAAGPFYCDTLLDIEKHYSKHLQRVASST